MDYEVIKISTAVTKNELDSGLSFMEGGQDIPFSIDRLYCVYESEGNKQCGFDAREHGQYILFCPYGEITVLVDDGQQREAIMLNDPSTGLILGSNMWREITWRQKNSVLCIAAHGHYDKEYLCSDYSAYMDFVNKEGWLSKGK